MSQRARGKERRNERREQVSESVCGRERETCTQTLRVSVCEREIQQEGEKRMYLD